MGYIRNRMERTQFAGEKRNPQGGSTKRSHVTGLIVGQEYEVKITEIGHNGDGIAKIDDYTVFVKNTELGDKVKIKIKKVKDTISFSDRLN